MKTPQPFQVIYASGNPAVQFSVRSLEKQHLTRFTDWLNRYTGDSLPSSGLLDESIPGLEKKSTERVPKRTWKQNNPRCYLYSISHKLDHF